MVDSIPPSTRLLLVDDDLDSLGAIARFLRLEGFEVVVADSPATANARLSEGPFDLLITDLKMPGETGVDLCLYVRKTNPALPVVLISGMAKTDDVVAAMRGGALTFLEKPIEPEALIDIIEGQLGQTTPQSEPDLRARAPSAADLPTRLRSFEAYLIEDALRQSGGQVKGAMEILGVGRRTLNYKMSRLGIDRALIKGE